MLDKSSIPVKILCMKIEMLLDKCRNIPETMVVSRSYLANMIVIGLQ